MSQISSVDDTLEQIREANDDLRTKALQAIAELEQSQTEVEALQEEIESLKQELESFRQEELEA